MHEVVLGALEQCKNGAKRLQLVLWWPLIVWDDVVWHKDGIKWHRMMLDGWSGVGTLGYNTNLMQDTMVMKQVRCNKVGASTSSGTSLGQFRGL